MRVSVEGLALIKEFEGCRLEAYRCAAGVATIGYGHTGKDVALGMNITQGEAEYLLLGDLRKVEAGVDALGLVVNQNQFDALVSFAYNLGMGALKKSTLIGKIADDPDDPSIRYEFLRWVIAGGKRLGGLVRRREVEADLYFSKLKIK